MAFATLRLPPPSQRGLIVWSTAITNAIRLITLFLESSTVIRAADWPAYVGIAVSSVIGVAVGSRLRARVRAETILRGLYILLLVSALTMFNVVQSALGIGLYLAALVVYLSVVAAMHSFTSVHDAVDWLRRLCASRGVAPSERYDGTDSPSDSAAVVEPVVVLAKPSAQHDHDQA